MTDFLLIMIGINICQIVSIIIAITIKRRKSIDYMGPSVDTMLDADFVKNMQIPELKDTVVIFFDFKCETCKQLIKEIILKQLSDQRIHYVASGSREEMITYKEKMQFNEEIRLVSGTYLEKQLKIQAFPFMIKITKGKVVSKGIASYNLLCEYLKREI